MADNSQVRNRKEFPNTMTLNEKAVRILEYAILAPSTHNSQPWLFKIADTVIEFYKDTRLLLPQADPRGRDLHISLGCAIENAVLAAQYWGVFSRIEHIAKNDSALVAKIFMYDGGEMATSHSRLEKLIVAITDWVNARGVFHDVPVPETVSRDILTILEKGQYIDDELTIEYITEREKIEKIAALTAKGLRLAYGNSDFRKEISHWINHSLSAKKQGIPGYSLRMPFLMSFVIPKLIRFFDCGALLSKLNYRSVSSAPLVAIISSRDDNERMWTRVGRLAERAMLEFHAHGFNTSIFVAAIEMADLYKELQSITKNKEMRPQFLFAVGEIDFLHKKTPRHTVTEKLIQ